MAYNFEEQDQLDDIKAFWNKYGTFILTVVTVIALSVAGYRLWGWYQQNQATEAATAYSVLQEAVRDEDMARIRGASQTLQADHSGTILASMGSLVAAKALFDAEDLDGAAQSLQWIVDNAADTELAPVARLRLAAVLLDQDQSEQGLALLNIDQMPESFKAMTHDRRGDLFTALARPEEAIAAYEAALAAMVNARGSRAAIELKLDAVKGGS